MGDKSNLIESEKLPIKFELNAKGKSYLLENDCEKKCEFISFDQLKNLIFDMTFSSIYKVPQTNENLWYTNENFENLQTVFVLFAQNVPFDEYREHKELFDESLNLFDYKFNYQIDFDRTSSIVSELCKVPVNCTSDGSCELPAAAATAMPEPPPKIICSKLDLLMSRNDMVLNGYVLSNSSFKKTKDCYANVTENSPMFAIDCEMVQTLTNDRALARISIVDENLNVLYDTYVKPREQITNYLTKFSGIRRETLRYCHVTVQDVQSKIRNILPDNAILVGHSLQSDLKAMEMTHPYVIDTSTIYNLSGSRRYKPSLKQLASELLGGRIQQGTHCSIEDAKTTMKLVQLKFSKGVLFGDCVNKVLKNRPKPSSGSNSVNNYYRPLSYYMKKLNVNSAIIANASQLYRFEFGNSFAGFSSDSLTTSAVTEMKRVLDRNYRNVISFVDFGRQQKLLSSTSTSPSTSHLKCLDGCLKEIWTRISISKSVQIVIFSESANSFKSGCFVRFSSACFASTND